MTSYIKKAQQRINCESLNKDARVLLSSDNAELRADYNSNSDLKFWQLRRELESGDKYAAAKALHNVLSECGVEVYTVKSVPLEDEEELQSPDSQDLVEAAKALENKGATVEAAFSHQDIDYDAIAKTGDIEELIIESVYPWENRNMNTIREIEAPSIRFRHAKEVEQKFMNELTKLPEDPEVELKTERSQTRAAV